MGKLHNFVVLDCETGGIDKKDNLHAIKYPITEVALLGINNADLTELARYESFVKGKIDSGFKPVDKDLIQGYVGYGNNQVYQQEALRVSNITVEKLESLGKEPKQVCLDIVEFLESCKSGSNFHKIIFVGHNVVYDIPFIQYLFKFCKKEKDLMRLVQGYMDAVGNYQIVYFDTQFISRVKYVDEQLKHSLLETSMREGFELVDAHQAMNDVVGTSEVFKKYLSILRSSQGEQSNSTTTSFRSTYKFQY